MAKAPKKTLRERIQDADVRAGMYLGNANEAAESGNLPLADKLYAKSQFWLDRYNHLVGNGERSPPKQ